MNFQRCFLTAYRLLLLFYPAPFRRRFAPEMLEIAESADIAEWPLIFGDTCVAILRCRIVGIPSTDALPEPNAYLAIGGSPVRRWGFLRGFVLTLAILVGLCYFSHWTAYRECPGKTSETAQQ
jgi:hypothetical protein